MLTMLDLKTYYATAGQIYQFFLGKGLTSAQAAGILAQADAESTLRPAVVGDHGQAFGLFQLHPVRADAIHAATGIDVHAATVEQQCEAVWWELHNSEKKALAAILAAKTAYDAGHDACRFYERPGSTAQYAIRGNKAENWAVWFEKHPVA
jgi:hypothetical protein